MEDNIILQVLVEAKIEYSKQLTNMLVPRLYEGIFSLYQESQKMTQVHPDKLLITFQTLLGNIPKWKNDVLENEFRRITIKSKCDWLGDLIIANFIAYTKVLSMVKINDTQSTPIDLQVPSGPHFIHQCYIEIARHIWKNPYLVYDIHLGNIDRQRNIRVLEKIIEDKILDSIRNLLPLKTILKKYLGEGYIPEREVQKVEEVITEVHKKNLKKMINTDIANTHNGNTIQLDIEKDLPNELEDKLSDHANIGMENLYKDFQKKEENPNQGNELNDLLDLPQEKVILLKNDNSIEELSNENFSNNSQVSQFIDNLNNNPVTNRILKIEPENNKELDYIFSD